MGWGPDSILMAAKVSWFKRDLLLDNPASARSCPALLCAEVELWALIGTNRRRTFSKRSW